MYFSHTLALICVNITNKRFVILIHFNASTKYKGNKKKEIFQ